MKKTYKDIFGQQLSKREEPYKEPVLLFTASALRTAAYAGWYSAFGEGRKTEEWVNKARLEWVQEIGATRRSEFPSAQDSDMWKYIPAQTMEHLVNDFFKAIQAEIKKGKARIK